jgi:hypothetical protein
MAGIAGCVGIGVLAMNMQDKDDGLDDDQGFDGPVTHTTVRFDIRHLSVAQLASLGVAQLAYVKPVVVNGTRAFAIHGADGTPMAVAGAEDLAFAAIRQHEMVPALVH